MKQKITSAKLMRTSAALSTLISCVYDAAQRYQDCQNVRPGKLVGLSRLLKKMLGTSHAQDYSVLESELKRKLIKAHHRVHGFVHKEGAPRYALVEQLPNTYQADVDRFNKELSYLLRVLADVQVKRG